MKNYGLFFIETKSKELTIYRVSSQRYKLKQNFCKKLRDRTPQTHRVLCIIFGMHKICAVFFVFYLLRVLESIMYLRL